MSCYNFDSHNLQGSVHTYTLSEVDNFRATLFSVDRKCYSEIWKFVNNF